MKNIVFVSIIDDEEIIRSLLLKILKTIEIEQVELDVAAFEGGIPFFESKRAEDSRNHLIILDGIMPAMDGMEIDHQGQTKVKAGSKKVKLDYGVDFYVQLVGQKNSRMMVDSYYDPFYYQYGKQLKMLKQATYASQKDNGVFHPIRLALNKEQMIPSTKKKIPFEDYETGVLKFGNANSLSQDFNSLTDVSISKDKLVLEGRIPWQLLNIKDPSLKEAMGDIWKGGLQGSVKLNGIRTAVVMLENDTFTQNIS